MRFQCSHCKIVLDIEDCEYGELVACGHCNAAVAVPLSPTGPGALLGDFLIVRELGQGGMGKVYLAHQVSLDRDVALKVLSADFARDANFIQFFINEARMAAALNHPNIVQAYAVNSDAEHYYFAMELIEGNTMKQVLQNSGRLVHEKVLSITTDIVAALAYAWQEKKLVHRDIKPDNIMLTYDGRTKLADMGLARKITETHDDGSSELYGTPQYIAPELILGAPGDLRSDIYSLGATLYHALSGGYPFQSADLNEMAMQHLCLPLQPLRERMPDVPAPLARMVEIMMAKRPQHRYQDYEQLQADLARVSKGQMPLHALPEDAQVPVDMTSEDPLNLAPPGDSSSPAALGAASEDLSSSATRTASSTGGLKLGQKSSKISLGGGKGAASATGKPGLILGGKSGETRISLPGTAAGSESESADLPAGGARKGRLGLVIGLVGLLLLGAVFAAWFFLKSDSESRADDSHPDGQLASVPGSSLLSGVLAKIQAGATEPEIMADLSRLSYEVEAGSADYDALLKLAGPYLEPRLQSARAEQLTEIQAGWTRRMEEFKEQQLQEEEAARLLAERKRQEAEAAREQQQREKAAQRRAEELEATKQQIRDTVVQCATGLDFSGARVPFAVLSQSSQEEERDWANQWLQCIDNAESLFLSLKNSKSKIAGVSLKINNEKGIPEEWKISTISYNTVRLRLVKAAHRRQSGKGKEEEEQEKSYELDQIAEARNNFIPLVQEALRVDGRSGEFDNLYGSFLLVRGEQAARQHLEAAMASESLLAELPLLTSSYVKAQVERLKTRTAANARQYERYLKKTFPDEFAPYEEEVKDIIKALP